MFFWDFTQLFLCQRQKKMCFYRRGEILPGVLRRIGGQRQGLRNGEQACDGPHRHDDPVGVPKPGAQRLGNGTPAFKRDAHQCQNTHVHTCVL